MSSNSSSEPSDSNSSSSSSSASYRCESNNTRSVTSKSERKEQGIK